MPIKQTNPIWAKDFDSKEIEQAKQQLTIGTNIYHWRKYRGLTQLQLADLSGITQSIVSNLEAGDYNPTLEMLNRISNTLNVSLDILTKNIIPWKMIETIDYIMKKLGSMDVLKAMKLIYFIDLESQESVGNKITGISYYRWHRGPFNKDIYYMDVLYPNSTYHKYNIESPFANYILLSKYDKKFIDKILKKYGDKDSSELMNLSYTTKPMKSYQKGDEKGMGEIVL